MTGVGIVTALRDGIAEVEVHRDSACAMMHEGDCGDCHGCDSPLRVIRADMDNCLGAGVGDRVEFCSPAKNVLLLSSLVFALPIVVMVAAYFIVHSFAGEGLSVLLSLLCAAAVFIVLKLLDPHLAPYARCRISRILVRTNGDREEQPEN